MAVGGDWELVELDDTAHALHHRALPDPAHRLIEVCRVTGPALVLGSTQRPGVADERATAAAGVEVTRRRSGGGAVLLEPATSVWIDVTVPRDDELWDDDITRSFGWLGRRWVAALGALGIDGVVPDPAGPRTSAGALVCFAGLGAGEVTVGGRKVVGLSQRRTRAAARFQSLVYVRGAEPRAILELLAEPVEAIERDALGRHLDATVGTVDRSAAAVVAAVLATFG